MFGKLSVVPQGEYETWAKGKAPQPTAAKETSTVPVVMAGR
jgi:hypothetical protein